MSLPKRTFVEICAGRSKYRNKPTRVDGIRFASQAEAARYQELKLLQAAQEIHGLRCHPKFPLVINGKTICTYVGDFYFRANVAGTLIEIVEDVKGFETAAFKIKAKLMKALHPSIDLRVVPA